MIKDNIKIIKDFFYLVKGHKKWTFLLFFASIMAHLTSLLIPVFAANIIYEVTIKDALATYTNIALLALTYIIYNLFWYLNYVSYSYNFKYSYKNLREKIIDKIFNKKRVVGIMGNSGSGKTITTIIINELLLKYKNKKTVIIKDNIKDKTKIDEQINKIKNKYDYIFIDIHNLNNYKFFEKILDENILILNSNILEINKIKKFIINNILNLKIILNNYNENSISEEILKSGKEWRKESVL